MFVASADRMRSKLINQHDQRVFAVIFDVGEDPMKGLERFAVEQNLNASSFTAIGAFSEAMLGYFDWEKKDYERIPVRVQTEVLALLGDIAVEGRNLKKVHAHVVLGKRDGSACGGHLLAASVRPTLEVILTESPGYLQRRHDPASGLTLIRF
jgi:predicted DNA-binding protein with PD1-like motif